MEEYVQGLMGGKLFYMTRWSTWGWTSEWTLVCEKSFWS